MNKRFGDRDELTGSTYMVKCADGVTPCHLGYYDLKSETVSVRAYPDGSLAIESYDVIDLSEHGTGQAPIDRDAIECLRLAESGHQA